MLAVAQVVERRVVVAKVAGSKPVGQPKLTRSGSQDSQGDGLQTRDRGRETHPDLKKRRTKLFNLIVLDCGSVNDSWLFNSRPSAMSKLADWCRDNWHDDEADCDDFGSNEEMIDWFFENWEDYSWCVTEIEVPIAVPAGQDIPLTPGLCRIVRESLSNFQFNFAQIILDEEEENELGTGEQVLEELIKQFE